MAGENSANNYQDNAASSARRARPRSILRRGPRCQPRRNIQWATTLCTYQDCENSTQGRNDLATPERLPGAFFTSGSPFPRSVQASNMSPGAFSSPISPSPMLNGMSPHNMAMIGHEVNQNIKPTRQGARKLNYSPESLAFQQQQQQQQQQHFHDQCNHGQQQHFVNQQKGPTVHNTLKAEMHTPINHGCFMNAGTPSKMPTPANLFAGKRIPLSPLSPNTNNNRGLNGNANQLLYPGSPVSNSAQMGAQGSPAPVLMNARARYITSEVHC